MFLDVHLVFGVGTTEVAFGGFVEPVFVVLEQIRELQKLMLSIFDISRLAGLEAGLQRGMDLERGNQRRNARKTDDNARRTFTMSSTGVYWRSVIVV